MAEAQVHYEAALVLARQHHNPHWLSILLANLGNLHGYLGRLEQARQLCQEALKMARQRGDRLRECSSLNSLGMLNCLLGHLSEARSAADAAHRLSLELAHARLECGALETLGLIDANAGQADLARVNYQRALELATELGNQRAQAQIRCQLGLAKVRLRDTAAGLADTRTGLSSLRLASDPSSLALALCAFSEAAWLAGLENEARLAAHEARDLVMVAQAGPGTESGAALARLEQVLLGSVP
jgi:tetratricopeptide (TPR) repeat protein